MADGSTIAERAPGVDVVTFGCRLNAYESEQIKARAAADGLADTVVFNTCAVTGEAVRQARQAIRRARRERPGARIVVTGCAAQIDPAAFAAMAEVDLVLGNADKAAEGAYADTGERVRVNDIMAVRETAPHLADGLAERARAYVEVQNGCDHRCTFCVIPYGRGNSRSAAAGEVVEKIRRLAAAGYREVVLTGVDLTSWGADLPGAPSLGQLVARILKLVPELPRLRLSSIDAAEIDPDLMRCLAEEPRLAPYLHLSLQAGDDMILKRMKRRHLRADALRLVAEVRAARPDTAFGCDLIAGFPTETEAMFANTLSLVEEAGLSFLHVFPFSPRPGTPAARMPQLPRAVIKHRAARLRAAGDAALARHLDRQVGRTVFGLVERDGLARADDFTEIAFPGEAPIGEIARFQITGHDGRRAHSPFPLEGEGPGMGVFAQAAQATPRRASPPSSLIVNASGSTPIPTLPPSRGKGFQASHPQDTSTLMTTPLIIERREGVAVLTLNRPEARNALDGEALYAAFEQAAKDLNADLSVGCVVLTGAGPAFCAGGNVKDMRARTGMFAGRPDQIARQYENGIQRVPLALWSIEAPVIAAVNGPAIGAGCDLALFCDIRIAADTATFAESFVRLGMIAGDGGGWILPRLVGPQAAAVLALTGETIGAAEALRCGLVWKTVPAERLMDEALAMAEAIAANPVQAVRWTKRMMRDQQNLSLADFLHHAAHIQAIAHHTPDHPEAVARAFAPRGRP